MSSHHFDTRIAEIVGVNAAVIAENIKYWCAQKAANGQDVYEGRSWVYNSVKAWRELFPYMSESQIRTSLEKLKAAGIILSGNMGHNTHDRTLWYCISSFEISRKCIGEKSPMDWFNFANGFAENRKSYKDNNKPNNKPNNKQADLAKEVFSYYNQVAKRIGWVVHSKLSDSQERSLNARIKSYGKDRVCAFIDALSRLQWTHKGFRDNPDFRLSLTYVLRARTFDEHFDKLCPAAPPKRDLLNPPEPEMTDLERCFADFAKTGIWAGERFGWAAPDHPAADYSADLYQRFGVKRRAA